MSKTAAARAEGAILIDKRVTIPAAIAIAALLAGGGIGYASMLGRLQALETNRAEIAPRLSDINDRTIRIEEQVKFIREAIAPKRP